MMNPSAYYELWDEFLAAGKISKNINRISTDAIDLAGYHSFRLSWGVGDLVHAAGLKELRFYLEHADDTAAGTPAAFQPVKIGHIVGPMVDLDSENKLSDLTYYRRIVDTEDDPIVSLGMSMIPVGYIGGKRWIRSYVETDGIIQAGSAYVFATLIKSGGTIGGGTFYPVCNVPEGD